MEGLGGLYEVGTCHALESAPAMRIHSSICVVEDVPKLTRSQLEIDLYPNLVSIELHLGWTGE